MITTGIFPPDIGGPATYIPRFADFLSFNKFNVEVLTLSQDSSTGSPHHSFNVLRIKKTRKRWLRILITIFSIARKVRNTDFIFCNGLYFETALAMRFTFFRGHSLVKIVGDPVWERARNRGITKPSIQGKLERKLITWSLEQFDHVTTPGESLAGIVGSWSDKFKVKVVHNGVPIYSKKHDDVKRYDLIVISRLVAWKNVDIVISIAKELNCSLVVIGDGPQRQLLEEQALDNTNIVFLGVCNAEEIVNLLGKSRIFCQLSDYEGLSFSLLQAMSSSLPCVLSDIQANRNAFDLDQDAAVFVQARDVQQASIEISRLLTTPEIQKDLGIRAQLIARQKFDERDRMREMMELMLTHD